MPGMIVKLLALPTAPLIALRTALVAQASGARSACLPRAASRLKLSHGDTSSGASVLSRKEGAWEVREHCRQKAAVGRGEGREENKCGGSEREGGRDDG